MHAIKRQRWQLDTFIFKSYCFRVRLQRGGCAAVSLAEPGSSDDDDLLESEEEVRLQRALTPGAVMCLLWNPRLGLFCKACQRCWIRNDELSTHKRQRDAATPVPEVWAGGLGLSIAHMRGLKDQACNRFCLMLCLHLGKTKLVVS